MKVTAIIPLRISEHVYQARKRLAQILSNIPLDMFNVLVLDYGTAEEHRFELGGIDAKGVRVIRHECERDAFSIGHARDLGVQYATDQVVMFHDIDFFGTESMYRRIHAEVCARDMQKNAYEFFCVPVFFLTEKGSEKCVELANERNNADLLIHRHLFEGTQGFIEFPAYGSSAMVVNKHHYLSIGGHSREFFGHGAEDYDVLHRLAAYYPKGPRTADYYLDTKSNAILQYRGFRAYFALYGIDAFARGIFFVHLWHPKRAISGYFQSSRNFALLGDLMQRFDKGRDQPVPLGDLTSTTRALVLVNPQGTTFKALRHVLPALGDFRIHPEDDFADADEVASFVRAQKITRVLLLNPYGNGHRLSIYRRLRDLKIPYYVFDRGALPESWFFDPNGFNFDSDSYAPSMWDKPLTQSETRQVENYISDLRSSADALEENGSRTSSRHLRERFGIGARKVLFVPFQRPSDTVTTYFAGPSGSVAGFQSWVAYVASKLPKSEWTVICKNHPLERNLPRIEGVMYADDSVHVHDLLELADKVFLMNSGVGVLAMAFGKPVICAAKAFYDHPGICHSVETKEEALDLVKREVAVSEEKCKRFIWHLRRRVYSFGQSKYKKTVGADGADRNMVMEIIFESIRFLGSEEVRLGRPRAGVSLDAPLFASFGGRVGVKASIASKRTANNTPLPGSAPPAPATAATSHGVDLAADTPAAAKGSMQTQINRLEASDALVSTVQRVSSGNIEESQTRLGVPAAHEASVRPAGSGWSETTGGRRQVALDFQQKRHAIGRRGETTSSGRGLLRGLLKSRPSA